MEKVRWEGERRNIHQAPYATSSAHKFSTFFCTNFSSTPVADIVQKFPENSVCAPHFSLKSFKNAFLHSGVCIRIMNTLTSRALSASQSNSCIPLTYPSTIHCQKCTNEFFFLFRKSFVDNGSFTTAENNFDRRARHLQKMQIASLE